MEWPAERRAGNTKAVTGAAALMHHQYGDLCLAQDMARDPAKQHLAHTTMGIGTHQDQARMFTLSRRQQ